MNFSIFEFIFVPSNSSSNIITSVVVQGNIHQSEATMVRHNANPLCGTKW